MARQDEVSETDNRKPTTAQPVTSKKTFDEVVATDLSPAIIIAILAGVTLALLIAVVTAHKFCFTSAAVGRRQDRRASNDHQSSSASKSSNHSATADIGEFRPRPSRDGTAEKQERRTSALLRRQSSLPFARPAIEQKNGLDTPSTSFSSFLHLKSIDLSGDNVTPNFDESLMTSLEVSRVASNALPMTERRRSRSVTSASAAAQDYATATLSSTNREFIWHTYSRQSTSHQAEPDQEDGITRRYRRSRTTSSVSSIHHSLQATSSLGSETSHCLEPDDDENVFCGETESRGSHSMPQLVTFPDFSDTNRTPTPPGAMLRSRLSSVSPTTLAENASVRNLHGETHRTLSGGEHLHGSHNPVLFHRAESCQSLVERTASGESQRSIVAKQTVAACHSHTASFKPRTQVKSAEKDSAAAVSSAASKQEVTPSVISSTAQVQQLSDIPPKAPIAMEKQAEPGAIEQPEIGPNHSRPSSAASQRFCGYRVPADSPSSLLTAPAAARYLATACHRVARGPANITTRSNSAHNTLRRELSVRTRDRSGSQPSSSLKRHSTHLAWVQKPNAVAISFFNGPHAPKAPTKSTSMPCLAQHHSGSLERRVHHGAPAHQQLPGQSLPPAMRHLVRDIPTRGQTRSESEERPGTVNAGREYRHSQRTEVNNDGAASQVQGNQPMTNERRSLHHASSLPVAMAAYYDGSDDGGTTTSAESSLSSCVSSDSDLDLPALAASYPWSLMAASATGGVPMSLQQYQDQSRDQTQTFPQPHTAMTLSSQNAGPADFQAENASAKFAAMQVRDSRDISQAVSIATSIAHPDVPNKPRLRSKPKPQAAPENFPMPSSARPGAKKRRKLSDTPSPAELDLTVGNMQAANPPHIVPTSRAVARPGDVASQHKDVKGRSNDIRVAGHGPSHTAVSRVPSDPPSYWDAVAKKNSLRRASATDISQHQAVARHQCDIAMGDSAVPIKHLPAYVQPQGVAGLAMVLPQQQQPHHPAVIDGGYEMQEMGVTPAVSMSGSLDYNPADPQRYYYNFSSFRGIAERTAARFANARDVNSALPRQATQVQHAPPYLSAVPQQEVLPLTAHNLRASADGCGVGNMYDRYRRLNATEKRNSRELSSNSIASRSSSDRTAGTSSTLTDGRFYNYDDLV